MKPNAAVAELLDYFRDLGFVDLRSLPTGTAGDRVRGAAPSASIAAPSGTAGSSRSPDSPDRSNSPAFPDSPDGETLALVAAEAAECRRCRLCETRSNVVFGSGPADARVVFVGEGPGAEEDRRGLPFVGAAGDLLTKILEAIGLRRDEVYIANIVKCRPPGNRDPAPDEIAACRGYLERQVDLLRPRLIVALGRVAAQTLLGREESLGRMRGQWHEFRGVPLRVTYHPAALLRNRSFKRPTWEDMQLIRDRLNKPESSIPSR